MGGMGAEWSFLLWIIVLVVVFFILRNFGIGWWPALVGALIIAWFFLAFAFPWVEGCPDGDHGGNGVLGRFRLNVDSRAAGVGVIGLITIILVLIYLFQQIFKDRDCIDDRIDDASTCDPCDSRKSSPF